MLTYHQKVRKYEKTIGAYLAKQFFEGFPDNVESKRQIVHLCYDQVWGNKKKVLVPNAKDSRIRKVAQDLWNRSKDLVSILNEEQKLLLQNEVEFKRTGNIDKYGERVGIMLDSQWHENPEFRDAFLNLVNSKKYKNMQF